MSEVTSNQVEKTAKVVPNPEGKGGFAEHPENINKGGYWDSTMSISYQYKRFLKMTPQELEAYSKIPPEERTVAMDIAYAQVIRSQKSLNHAKEVTDRTEGKAQQHVDMTTAGEAISTGHDDLKLIAEVIKDANRNREPNDPTRSTDGLADPTQSS